MNYPAPQRSRPDRQTGWQKASDALQPHAWVLRLTHLLLAAFLLALRIQAATPLTTLEYRVMGSALRVTPPVLSVPKGIAGSVLVQLNTGGPAATANSLADGSYIEATLRGPSFPARQLVGQPNQPLLLPPLALVGDYQLDNIRLVDAATRETRMEAVPASVPVHVFDEVLISRVTSRPLTLEEIQDKGIYIDNSNFRAVEFEVGFVLDGKTFPVRFPVIAPTFTQSTEIIPAAELEKRLAEASILNQQISGAVELPPELEQSRLNIQVQGINFQPVEMGETDLALRVPPIPALMVIPGNIGFLNQFFSVQIFTENGAPQGSGLSVFDIRAELKLPPGPDRIASTNYDNPGDDPLRFARLGPDRVVQPVQAVVRPGPDGKAGTADDIGRLYPREAGEGEFLVEGLQEGLHVMDIELTGNLDGLAAGTVTIKGKAAGSVLVRNPRFSMAFSHPRTIRAGEPYDAFVTILNTSSTVANLVQVTLSSASISGGVLESAETVQLGTILPGQTATARYRIRAQRTGAISFSNLTTSDDSLVGRFRLKAGIDERGVALSPDTIAMPDFVNALSERLLAAANRVLGQALSVATAGQLPPGVLNVPKSIITKRVLELAEAGQRLRYDDPAPRVLADLLLDWQGGRHFNAGFDQILRQTEAGQDFRTVLAEELEAADTLDSVARLAARAADLAGRSERWVLAAVDSASAQLSSTQGTNTALLASSSVVGTAGYPGARGHWLVAGRIDTNMVLTWTFTNTLPSTELSVLWVETNGTAQHLRWTITDPPAGACYSFALADPAQSLAVDLACDGTADTLLPPRLESISESAPQVIAVLQEPTVLAGRPSIPCSTVPGFPRNYATVVALLFSKPMSQESVAVPSAYQLSNSNRANSVQIQPGGRVALLNLAQPVGALRARTLAVTGVSDPRGNPVATTVTPVQSELTAGTAIRGRVVRADGSLAAAVPVTLTYYDLDGSGFDCRSWVARVSQVFTDPAGFFSFDFVLSGIPYSISATDTAGLSAEAIQLVLESAAGDAFARSKLLELLNSQTNQNSLLSGFATTSLPQAIAQAEGLDRALLRDLVPAGSPREGTETVVALRFRGRGIVTGQVLAADGVTPVSGVAVNLFPDPDSRELGRGVFSDNLGTFAFHGVPLGLFTVQATAPNGQARTVAGVLDQVGQTNQVTVVLSSIVSPLAALRGRVVEPDALTPHPNARVFVGRFNDQGKFVDVVAAVTADADGFWIATNFPAGTYDVAAVSFDGQRKGDRRKVQASLTVDTFVNISLNGRTTVSGRVEFFNGLPATNALVAGGDTIVRTDSRGVFTLTGVPTGRRTISAGVERNPAAGIDFPRLGSASLDVIGGLDNFAVIRLRPAGRIAGRVLDAAGQPIPNTRIAIPQDGGFLYVDADAQGNYLFENLPLGNYTVSAPAPATAKTDTSGLISRIKNGNEAEIEAALGEAFRIFAGLTDPFLTGEPFNPATWGFNRTQLTFDGQTAVADIRHLRPGTVGGMVLNGQGVPIGAKVRLTGIGPQANGEPTVIIRGEMNSDPALGTFSFPNGILVGPFGLQAASPFFPTVISSSGQTTSTEPNSTNNVLQFPATRESNGRLTGVVFYPDGSRVSSNVNVKISFGPDFVIRTDANGFFDTQIGLPALGSDGRPGLGYSVEADDPLTGLRGLAVATVLPGVTNVCNVRLLGKGTLEIVVRQASGTPATNATVEVQQGAFPNDRFAGVTDTNGTLRLQNIFAGPYAVSASFITGPTTIFGRTSVTVAADQTAQASVVLGPTATIRGIFVRRDLLTPVAFAQVAVGSLGFATTDSAGRFEVAGIPLGNYRLVSQDPVTGIGATLNLTLNLEGEIRNVSLVEQSRGEVKGGVLDGYGAGFVAAAIVTLRVLDGITPSRTVSTGPDGQFSFPGTPAADFILEAQDTTRGFRGSVSGTLPATASQVSVNVQLQPLTRLAGRVLEPDGVTPATNATVRLLGPSGPATTDTDALGRVAFADLPLGNYVLRADSRRTGATHSAAQTSLVLSVVGNSPDFALSLAGVGSVSGRVLLGDGTTPAAGAEVVLESQVELFRGLAETVFAGTAGEFSIANIPVGPYRLSAKSAALGSSAAGRIDLDGEADTIDLVLGASGSVRGRIVRAAGSQAVPGIDVSLTFNSQSGLPGIAVARTDAAGSFTSANIPLGSVRLEAIAPSVGGLARLAFTLTANGQTNDLGDLPLDEDFPRVTSVEPAHTASGVPTATAVTLVFSEALAANSLNTNGIFLRSDTEVAPAALQLLPDPTNSVLRLVRLTPLQPLRSQKTYQVVVIDGTRSDAFGATVASGPTDLVGRPLATPFVSAFTTADNDPPVLVSQSPAHNEIQVDPRVVLRLSFNETIQSSNFVFTLIGPAGPVPGTAGVGLNGLVVTFTPEAPLPPNGLFTYELSGIRDHAGNLAANQPIIGRFSTLDTLGPTIASLRLAASQAPVAGATVTIEAVLTTNETGASVRFTQDFQPLGTDNSSPFSLNAKLPLTGSTTLRAIATDRFGNDGPFAELVLTVQSNQPPALAFARGVPSAGPLTNDQAFSLVISATDDVAVTNMTVVGVGAVTLATNFANGGLRTLDLVVPSNAIPGTLFQFQAQATDALGVKSPVITLDFELLDTQRPAVSLLSPLPGTVLDPARPLELIVVSSDNSTNHLLEVTLSGPLATNQTLNVISVPNTPTTNSLFFGLAGISTDGANITATVRASDMASNSTVVTRSFVLPDTRPPQLLSSQPTNGTARVSLWPAPSVFSFDEALDPATATNNVATTNSGGFPHVTTVALGENNRQLRVSLSHPLQPGVTYTNRLLPGLADSSTNGWQSQGGLPVPPDGVPFVFTTARILEVTPANGTSVPAGQPVTVSVGYEPGLGAGFFRFQINSGPAVQVIAGTSNASAVLDIPLRTQTAVIAITASDDATFTKPFSLSPVTLNVLADTRPPQLAAVTPTDGAPRQSLWLTNQFEFDEPIDPATVPTNAVRLTNSRGSSTPVDIVLADGNRRLIVRPQMPLLPGVTYTNTLVAELADLSGNRWRNLGGQAVSPNGASFTFTTAAILEVSPSNGTSVFAGQPVNAAVRYEAGLEAGVFRFEITGSSPVTIAAGLTNASALLSAPNLETQAVIQITASQDGSFADPFRLDPITIQVLPLIGDLDGDGIPDDQDPDIDGDELANANEALLGTDPRKPDTDGDGWRDAVEVEAGSNPLLASSVPLLFVVGEPATGLILPALLNLGDVTNGVVVAQPQIGLTLPALDSNLEIPQGLVVGHPSVGLILPAGEGLGDLTPGMVVGQPAVALILPANPGLSQLPTELIVAQPQVALILPTSPAVESGLVVAEPVVMLRLNASAGLKLRLVQRQPSVGEAVSLSRNLTGQKSLEISWPVPLDGNYVLESSTDLRTWVPAAVETLPSDTGMARVSCDAPGNSPTFYRLRRIP
jgi:hypothetical protein